MLQLRFFNEAPPGSKQVSGEAFLFDYTAIHAQPGRNVVARHVNDHWLVGGGLFLKVECRGTVECLFDRDRDSQQRQGPFDHVVFIDGVLTADKRPLAILHDRRGWSSLVGDETWVGLCLVRASASGTASWTR